MTKQSRPRNITNDLIDAVETATSKWTRQKKSEERHPGMVRYRLSRMTKEPRTSQKEAAWQVMEEAYMAASANGTLPALARQIFYQARPKIMRLTEDRELAYGYFSQNSTPLMPPVGPMTSTLASEKSAATTLGSLITSR